MLCAQGTIGSDSQLGFDLVAVHDRKFDDLNPRLVDHQFLSIIQSLPVEQQFRIDASLCSSGHYVRKNGTRRKSGDRRKQQDRKQKS
jgi:hypothetical protein